MTATVLAIAAAYVVMGVLLLSLGLTARLAWWVKAPAIVVTSFFFIEVFFATKGLLGWAASGPLPARFQLLWARVVEPDLKSAAPGAIYLWLEEVDANNVPDGRPRSYRLPYSRVLADRALKATSEIMAGKPQEGLAEDMAGYEAAPKQQQTTLPQGSRVESGLANVDMEVLQGAPRVESFRRAVLAAAFGAEPYLRHLAGRRDVTCRHVDRLHVRGPSWSRRGHRPRSGQRV